MTNCYSFPLPTLMYLNFSDRCCLRRAPVTSAVRRHHRRRLLKYFPNSRPVPTPTIFKLSDDTLQITLKHPSTSIQQLETKLYQFLDYGREALDDLRTVVTINGENGGVKVSCRRSTVELVIALFISSWVVFIAFRSLFKPRNNGGEVLIYKRDRSLGGKEVVVGKGETNWSTSRKSTPLSSDSAANYYRRKRNRTTLGRRRKEELPQWWPQNLRRICKTYGVRTSISTENARDSLYRVSVNFVLDCCESISTLSTAIQIDGEDVWEFIAGLADNIGLESVRAARIVSAAVAARTRSRILQAWALEVQNKHSEAMVELFKVCLIHRIFPPEENSPEMEMVARGLDKSLDVEQREHILNSFITVCGKDIDQSLVEALGLGGVKDEQGNQHGGVKDEQGNQHVQIE
ncbi:hypothetical protein CDL12_06757 [Handroanthus impetiginosus]|uniref:Uncharacterized protein n=1 Tax=Handroanthus impetiginosus TaxID=429701 RepID=A0A2G9HSR6_9LAMI|nr:hypothetical protein CDL12_06757 [Handroanthus impetiginosus]